MKTLTIRATTTDEQIENAIPYLDMRQEATERRDDAKSVLTEQGDQVALELHQFGDIMVLFSPAFGYAMVNEASGGVGNSLLLDSSDITTPEQAAKVWAVGLNTAD